MTVEIYQSFRRHRTPYENRSRCLSRNECVYGPDEVRKENVIFQLKSEIAWIPNDDVLDVSNEAIGVRAVALGSDNLSGVSFCCPSTVIEGHPTTMPPQAVQRGDGGDNQGGMSVRNSLGTMTRISGVQANRLIVNSPLCPSKHSHLYDSAIRHLSILRQ